jgi:hypothetical protein
MIKGKYFNNDQEFFDAAWDWLITKNNPKCVKHRFSSPDQCLYRKVEEDGAVRTCVIGAFIPDELINDELLEGVQHNNHCVDTSIVAVLKYGSSEVLKDWFKNVTTELLSAVQLVHDEDIGVDARNNKMTKIAQKHNLSVPSLV